MLLLRKGESLYGWVLMALTDLAVSAPWLLLMYRANKHDDWFTAVPGVWLALLVYGAASLWEAAEIRLARESRRRRVMVMLVGTAGAYLTAYSCLPAYMKIGLLGPNPAWGYVPVAAYLWYQGTVAVVDGLHYHRLFSRFPWQVVGAAVGIIFLVKADGASEPAVQVLLYWSVALVLAGGLLSLLVARERHLRAGQTRVGEQGGQHQSRLLSAGVLSLLALTFAASYAAGAGGPDALAGWMMGSVGGLLHFLGSVAGLILHRWSILFGPYVERWVRWFLAQLAGAKLPFELPQADVNVDDIEPLVPFSSVLPYLRAAAVVGLVVVLLIAVARSRRRAMQTEEEIISLGFWKNLLADLKILFGGRAAAVKVALAPPEGLEPMNPRMLFRRLQHWGEGVGRPRQACETPNAYCGVLGAAHPGYAGAVAAVTRVYNQARYGAAAPEAAEVAAAVEAVTLLEAGQ